MYLAEISEFLSEIFQFLVVKFSVYLNRHVFVMHTKAWSTHSAQCLLSVDRAFCERLYLFFICIKTQLADLPRSGTAIRFVRALCKIPENIQKRLKLKT